MAVRVHLPCLRCPPACHFCLALDAWWASTADRLSHRPCAGAFETPDINSVDLKPIIDKKCHVNCHHAWEEYEKCEKRIEAKESGDCASWYMDYLKCIDTCASQVLFKGLH